MLNVANHSSVKIKLLEKRIVDLEDLHEKYKVWTSDLCKQADNLTLEKLVEYMAAAKDKERLNEAALEEPEDHAPSPKA